MSSVSDRAAVLIEDSVRRAVEGKKIAVAFSGGVDSGLVGALSMKYAESVHLYVAGVPGCHDIEAAESAAKELGADLSVIEVSDPVSVIKSQMIITKVVNPLILAFSSPLYCVMSGCSEEFIAAGQGADEVFGGYNKYVSVPDDQLKGRMKEDADRFYRETFPHEQGVASHFGKTILRPYLDDSLVGYVDSLSPSDIRPTPESRKKILCDAATSMGYGFLANRPKKAAQYGSGILDSIKHLCKERGIEYNQLVAEIAVGAGLTPHRA